MHVGGLFHLPLNLLIFRGSKWSACHSWRYGVQYAKIVDICTLRASNLLSATRVLSSRLWKLQNVSGGNAESWSWEGSRGREDSIRTERWENGTSVHLDFFRRESSTKYIGIGLSDGIGISKSGPTCPFPGLCIVDLCYRWTASSRR